MKKITHIVTILLMLLCVIGAKAANVSDLYQGTVPVDDRSATARQGAVQAALKVVLVKVSGNANVASVPAVAARLSQANTLLQQYRYLAPMQTPVGTTGLQLQAKFDTNGVNQLLQQAGQALWPNHRPSLGVWLYVDGLDNTTHTITSDMDTADPLAVMPFLLEQTADNRGVPIVLPSAAMVKANPIEVDDLDNLPNTSVVPILTALHVDGLLVGRIIQMGDNTWQSHWTFILGQDTMQWQSTNTDLNVLFDGVLANVVDNLTQQFAVLPDNQNGNKVLLSIDQVKDAKTFSRLMRYLNQLSLVLQVQVVRVTDQTVVVALQTNGGEQALRQALQFGHVLVPAPIYTDDDSEIMRYQIVQ